MRKLIALLCVAGAALCVACIAWAGSPTSQSVIVRNNVLDVAIGQTADIAANAIDTVIVDLSKADWLLDSTNFLFLYSRITSQTMASGESLTVAIEAGPDGTLWDGTDALATLVLTGKSTNMVELVEWGRFLRFIIINLDDDAHAYDLLLSAPAR